MCVNKGNGYAWNYQKSSDMKFLGLHGNFETAG